MIKNSQKGFTLVELLIVMFIIGVLLVVVAVNFDKGKRTNDLKAAAIDLEQSFRLLKQLKTMSWKSSNGNFNFFTYFNFCNITDFI